jgi:hypothetical protein
VVAPAHSLGSAPATNYDPDNGSQNVYFEGPDGSLREISWTPASSWGHVIVVIPAGSLASAPATNYDPDNHSQNVYFAGPDGSLREISWTPSAKFNHVSVVAPAGTLTASGAGSAPPVATPPPTGSGSVSVTPPPPKTRHKLAVKILLRWTWNHKKTRLVRISVGRVPAHTAFAITCSGRGCPAHRLRVAGSTLQKHRRSLRAGKVYRAGDKLLVSLSAPMWKAERARIMIRNGHQPGMRLL